MFFKYRFGSSEFLRVLIVAALVILAGAFLLLALKKPEELSTFIDQTLFIIIR